MTMENREDEQKENMNGEMDLDGMPPEEQAQPGGRLHRFRKGVFIVPSLVTSAAFFCGFYTVVASINGDYYKAAWAIILAMILDGLDGRIARAMGATSNFGVEFDSLSDLMSFGLAPAILMYNWVLQPYGRLGWMAAFLFALCGALRLARFNIQQSDIRKDHFVGMPIPAAAWLLAATVLLTNGALEMEKAPGMVMLATVYTLALLMVSNVPYRNFKYIDTKKRRPFHLFLWIVLFLFIVALFPHHMLFAMAAAYMLHGPVEWFLSWRKGADDPTPNPEEETSGPM
ncbi:MAG: CDP-diacylglycerol--serine O-phosphatidyltransferase [Nitrospinota bacterium]|nr:CDP-diacylglycerol--serine O-phosphatidyltransferase [Nitrospinota bacterium]MDH5678357.1 CDP-diacylglycerol--serine O-phosphatidyltransferase [Nitrospinota bacterium]